MYANTPQLMCNLRTFAAAERALGGRTEFFSGKVPAIVDLRATAC
ncbi:MULTISPECIES: hypothetical protein [Mycolicibacterium]|nr:MULTISPECIES: hypothetical protein [Mycolicibacterium]